MASLLLREYSSRYGSLWRVFHAAREMVSVGEAEVGGGKRDCNSERRRRGMKLGNEAVPPTTKMDETRVGRRSTGS